MSGRCEIWIRPEGIQASREARGRPLGEGFRVWGLGFRVWGLEFSRGSGFRVWGLGFRILDLGFGV